MVKGCAILLLWITIGTNSYAQDCFYRKEILYKDGSRIEALERYDCRNSAPPEIIIKEVPAKNRSFGEFLFGVEEEGNGITHLFSSLVSMGVL